jgi:hypothetical protein
MCGRALDLHDRDMRFRLPEPVLRTAQQERAPGTWLSHEDPSRSVMMEVPGLGAFVRSLLPVQLTGGFTVTFGVWLAVRPDDLQRAYAVWWEPEYRDLVLDGRLANELPVWGLLAAHAQASVHDENETPWIDHSSDPLLARVLTERWPHDEVLGALPA